MDFTQDSSSYSFTDDEEEITCPDEAQCSIIEKSAIWICCYTVYTQVETIFFFTFFSPGVVTPTEGALRMKKKF